MARLLGVRVACMRLPVIELVSILWIEVVEPLIIVFNGYVMNSALIF